LTLHVKSLELAALTVPMEVTSGTVEITDIGSDKYEEPMLIDIWGVIVCRQTGGTTLVTVYYS
jgi:hypothetical protein